MRLPLLLWRCSHLDQSQMPLLTPKSRILCLFCGSLARQEAIHPIAEGAVSFGVSTHLTSGDFWLAYKSRGLVR